jgi:O-antigen/teichoic acid export membrane protein
VSGKAAAVLQSGVPQSGVPQSGLLQSGLLQSGLLQSGLLQSGRATDASTLRGSLLMFSGRIMASGVALFTQVLIIRALGKADFGTFAFALATAALVQSVLPLGLERADTRFLTLYHEEGDTGRVIGVVSTGLLVAAGTGLLAVASFAGWLVATGGLNEVTLVVLVLLVTAPLQAMDTMVLNAFAVFARPTAVFFRRYVIDPGLRLSVVLVLLVAGMSVRSLAYGYLAAGVTASLLYLVLLARLLRAVVGEAGASFHLRRPGRQLFAFAMPLLAGAVMYAATTSLPVLALMSLSTRDQVGELRAVQQLAQIMLIVPTAFATLFLPRAARQIARGEYTELREHYWATAVWVSVLAFPAALAMVAFAAQVTTTLFTDQYADASTALVILAVAFFSNAALGLNGSVLQVAGRVKQLLWSNVAGLVVVLAGCLALIPSLRATGAAIVVALGLAVPQAIKQWSLRGLSVGASHPSARRLWVSVAVLTGACVLVNQVAHPHVVVAGAVCLFAWAALLVVMRRDLVVGEVLPILGNGRRKAGRRRE